MLTDSAKRRIFEAIDGKHTHTKAGRTFVLGMSTLIILNVAAVVLETEPSVHRGHEEAFAWFETFSVVVFTIEYLLRVITCTGEEEFRGALLGRLKFISRPLSLVDLLAILPFYLPLLPVDLRVLRLFRFARFLRVLKLGRYSESMHTLRDVLRSKRSDLGVALSAIAILLLIASSLMYYVEHAAQPETFSSIPASMWWGVVTLTTVGYGDVYPVTGLGKVLASVIALCSVGLFALPAGILASGFGEEMRRRREPKQTCPHCGGRI